MEPKCHRDEDGSLSFYKHMEGETVKSNTDNGTVFQHILIPDSGEAMLLHNKGEGQVLNFCPYCGGSIALLAPKDDPEQNQEAPKTGGLTYGT